MKVNDSEILLFDVTFFSLVCQLSLISDRKTNNIVTGLITGYYKNKVSSIGTFYIHVGCGEAMYVTKTYSMLQVNSVLSQLKWDFHSQITSLEYIIIA